MSYLSRLSLLTLLLLAAMTWHGEANAAQLSLTWTDNSANEDGFKIERKQGPAATFDEVATVGVNISSFIDPGLADGTTYCYQVRAFNADGNSAYTNMACGATPAPSPANQPPVVSPITHDATDVDPATPGLQVWEGTIVTYTGSATDPDGNPLTWEWRYSVNGGSQILLTSGIDPPTPAQDVAFNYISVGPTPKTYVWILRANDGQATAESTLTVQVVALPPAIDQPPVVNPSQDPALDQYGGYVDLPAPGGSTGFFRVEKVGNRWIFVTPEGNAFWIRAVYGVDITDGGQAYVEALKQKYNSPGGIPWWTFVTQAVRRLRSWGFNALGEYHSLYALPVETSGRAESNPEKLPFIRNIHLSWSGVIEGRFKSIIAGTDPAVYTGWRGGIFADVFDPAFEAFALELASDARGEFTTPGLAQSPWLIGTTIDGANETYGFGQGPQASVSDAHSHLGWIAAVTAPTQGLATVYTKLAFRDFLRQKYQTLNDLNAAWGSTYTSWDSDGGWPNGLGVLDESGRNPWMGQDFDRLSDTVLQVKADLDAFLEVLADQYFSVVAGAVRAATPNHLVFSPAGIGAGAHPQVLRAAGRYLDVLQVWAPPDRLDLVQEASEVSARPVFVWSSVQAQADSPMAGQPGLGPSYEFLTQEARGQGYATYLDQLLTLQTADQTYPVVGIDWSAWTDQIAEGTNSGLVTTRDNAYDAMETIIAAGTDPWGYPTGGETQGYGDFLDSVTQANTQVDIVLSGQLAAQSSADPPSADPPSADCACQPPVAVTPLSKPTGAAAVDPITAGIALSLAGLAIARLARRRALKREQR